MTTTRPQRRLANCAGPATRSTRVGAARASRQETSQRRDRLVWIRVPGVIVLAALALTACGAGTPDGGTATPAAAAAVTATIEVAGEPVEVPADPARIATPDKFAGEIATGLAIEPVVVGSNFGSLFEDSLGAIETQVDVGEPDLEVIAGAEPDLIVTTEVEPDLYRR